MACLHACPHHGPRHCWRLSRSSAPCDRLTQSTRSRLSTPMVSSRARAFACTGAREQKVGIPRPCVAGDGFISVAEFQRAMLSLSGHDEASTKREHQERVTTMLHDLAAWVDRDGDGKIDYLEFISAFRIGAKATEDGASRSSAPTAVATEATEAIDMLLEHLCSFFYRHRWSLKHAFEVRPARPGAIDDEILDH